jgi:hypothetical protein
MVKHARTPGSRAADNAELPGPADAASGDQRPHVLAIAFGLLDAHVSGVDYFDTAGGKELLRLYRRRQLERHRAA